MRKKGLSICLAGCFLFAISIFLFSGHVHKIFYLMRPNQLVGLLGLLISIALVVNCSPLHDFFEKYLGATNDRETIEERRARCQPFKKHELEKVKLLEEIRSHQYSRDIWRDSGFLTFFLGSLGAAAIAVISSAGWTYERSESNQKSRMIAKQSEELEEKEENIEGKVESEDASLSSVISFAKEGIKRPNETSRDFSTVPEISGLQFSARLDSAQDLVVQVTATKRTEAITFYSKSVLVVAAGGDSTTENGQDRVLSTGLEAKVVDNMQGQKYLEKSNHRRGFWFGKQGYHEHPDVGLIRNQPVRIETKLISTETKLNTDSAIDSSKEIFVQFAIYSTFREERIFVTVKVNNATSKGLE